MSKNVKVLLLLAALMAIGWQTRTLISPESMSDSARIRHVTEAELLTFTSTGSTATRLKEGDVLRIDGEPHLFKLVASGTPGDGGVSKPVQVDAVQTFNAVRQFDGPVHLKWYGAIADWNGTTGTDNAAAINAAFAYATSNGRGLFLDGDYFTTGTHDPYSLAKVIGPGSVNGISNFASTEVVYVDTISDLFDIKAFNGKVYIVKNYSSSGDNGGQSVCYDSNSTDQIDGGFIFPGTGGSLAFSTVTGTIQSATTTTVTLDAQASSVDDEYNGSVITITSGLSAGQSEVIVDYNGTTKTATISQPFTSVPQATDTFEVLYYVFSGNPGIGRFIANDQLVAIAERFGSVGDGQEGTANGTDNLSALSRWAKSTPPKTTNGGNHRTSRPIVLGSKMFGADLIGDTKLLYISGSVDISDCTLTADDDVISTYSTVSHGSLYNSFIRNYGITQCMEWRHGVFGFSCRDVQFVSSGSSSAESLFVTTYQGQINDIRFENIQLRMWNQGVDYAFKATRTDSLQNFYDQWVLDGVQLEQCNKGGLLFMGIRNVTCRNIMAYDNTTITRPLIGIYDSAAPNFKRAEFFTIENYGRTQGSLSAGIYDIVLNSTSGRGGFTLINCNSTPTTIEIDCGGHVGTRSNIIGCRTAILHNNTDDTFIFGAQQASLVQTATSGSSVNLLNPYITRLNLDHASPETVSTITGAYEGKILYVSADDTITLQHGTTADGLNLLNSSDIIVGTGGWHGVFVYNGTYWDQYGGVQK